MKRKRSDTKNREEPKEEKSQPDLIDETVMDRDGSCKTIKYAESSELLENVSMLDSLCEPQKSEKQIEKKRKKIKRKKEKSSDVLTDSGYCTADSNTCTPEDMPKGRLNAKKSKKESEPRLQIETDVGKPSKRKKKMKEKELTLSDTKNCVSGSDSSKKTEDGRKNDGQKLVKEGSDVEIKACKAKSKKAKRKEKKRRKKKMANEGDGEKGNSMEGTAQTTALNYLRLWANNKEEWKFQKVRQVWLLSNLFNNEKVQDEDFTILMSYLEGLKGKSRHITLQNAEKIMKMIDSDSEDSEEVVDARKQDRAKQVIQILS